MKFSATTLLLLATSVAAVPSGGLAGRLAHRSARTGHSHPLVPAPETGISPESTNTSSVQYSSNWSGAVLTAPPSGQTFNKVVGTFTVPKPKAGSGTRSASAWVGIDGDTYQDAILQSGVDFTVGSGGAVSYQAWYEWYPNDAFNFDSFSMAAGDQITVTIAATSLSAGKVTLENLTTGKSVSKSLTAPSSSSKLGGQNAEWIVEDYEEGSSLVPLANFGEVTFTGAQATGTGGTVVGLTGATIIDIKQGKTVYTSVTVESDTELEVSYV